MNDVSTEVAYYVLSETSPDLLNRIKLLGKRVNKKEIKKLIVELCSESPKTKSQLAAIFGRDEEYMKKFYLSEMVGNELELINPDKPTDPNQAYKVKE